MTAASVRASQRFPPATDRKDLFKTMLQKPSSLATTISEVPINMHTGKQLSPRFQEHDTGSTPMKMKSLPSFKTAKRHSTAAAAQVEKVKILI